MMILEAIQDFFTQHLLLSISAMLIVGYAFGKLASRVHLPEITGFIISGVLLGPSLLGLASAGAVQDLGLVTDVTLGLIAFTVGGEFYWLKLKRMGRGVVVITIVQIAAAFLATSLGLVLFRMSLPYALVLGAIATATAPSATVAVVQSLNATGKFVDYLYGVVALDDAGAVIVFGVVFAVVSGLLGPEAAAMGGATAALGPESLIIIGEAFFEVAASIVLGIIAGFAINALVRKRRNPIDILILALGIVLLTTGLALSFHLSSLLTNMAAGAVLINLGARNHRIFHILEPLTPPVYLIFFVLAGAQLNLAVLGNARVLLLGLVFIVFRAIGKYGGVALGAKLAKAPKGIARYLGVCMLPEGGVELGLVLLIQASPLGQYLAETQGQVLDDIMNIVLIAIFVNVVIGPPLSKMALLKGLELEE